MPKRTNDFQALIALVERQLAASGVRVVESEMLADRLTGELRGAMSAFMRPSAART